MDDERSEWIETRVEPHGSRFELWIDVFLVDADGNPSRVESRRLDSYPDRRAAEVAAYWVRRGAKRGSRESPRHPDDPA